MGYLTVGMDQAVTIPRPSAAFDGLATHGIDSCTGLAIASVGHIFLAHVGPTTLETVQEWRGKVEAFLYNAVSKMQGNIVEIYIVSPNDKGQPGSLGADTIADIFTQMLVGLRNRTELTYSEREKGNRFTFDTNARISVNGDVIKAPKGALTTIPEDGWLVFMN